MGRLLRPKSSFPVVQVASVTFANGQSYRHEITAPPDINDLDFEIRVYSLEHRQPQGIKVGDAREYLNEFGGVHVYDAGFHLPYYGPETDWLSIEIAHSVLPDTLRLLPLQTWMLERGLNFLPTNSRLLGVVNVDTLGRERRVALQHDADSVQYLSISGSRVTA